MTAIFTDSFRAAIAADGTLMDMAVVEMVMFSTAAGLALSQENEELTPTSSSPYAAIDTIAGLETSLGWGPAVSVRVSSTMPGNSINVVGTSTYYIQTDDTGWVLPGSFPKSLVKVIAFVYKGTKQGMQNKIMFLTDRPVTANGTVMQVGDGVIPQADPVKGRLFISWAADGVTEGSLVRTVGPKDFEPARTQHLWIYAQRMNMIANPSFEEDVDYWRSDGVKSQLAKVANNVVAATTVHLPALTGLLKVDTVQLVAGNKVLVKDQNSPAANGVYLAAVGSWTRSTDSDTEAELKGMEVYVKGGSQRGETWTCLPTVTPIVINTTPLPFAKTQTASTGVGNFAGRFAGKIAESNMFPFVTRINEEGWTVQMRARSNGEIKVGFVAWAPDFASTSADWGDPDERWISNGGWLHIHTCRRVGEMTTGMLRVETQGTYLDLDQVCVEFGTMPANYSDWAYFDGNSLYGTDGDYSWYERPNKSYSCWYNDRTAVFGRLFAWNMSSADAEPGGVFTDEEAAKQGLAHQWVPAGTPLQYHTDILYPGDPRNALPVVTGSPLLRQDAAGLPVTAVPNAWVAREATAGAPGTWGPTSWLSPTPAPPDDFVDLKNSSIVAYPATPWTPGQYVQTRTSGEDGRGYWAGSGWVQGTA